MLNREAPMLIGQPTNYLPSWLLKTAIIFFVSIIVLTAAVGLYETIYHDKIYPGVWLGSYNLVGKNADEIRQLVNQQTDKISQQGIKFSYQDSQTTVYPVVTSLEGDLAYRLIVFDNDKTVNQAWNFGRDQDFFTNLTNQFSALVIRKKIPLAFLLDKPQIQNNLQENFRQFEQPAEDAKLMFDKTNSSDGLKVEISQEKTGKIIDYQKAINQLVSNLNQLKNPEIKLTTKTDYPAIKQADCLNIDSQVTAALNLAPLNLVYNQQSWVISRNQLADWLTLKDSRTNGSKKIIVGLNQQLVEKYLNDEVAAKINQEPIDAKFQLNNGRVTEFQKSQDGQKIDLAATYDKINSQITAGQTGDISLVVTVYPSTINTANINDFGIKEIIGIGESNFSGSPVNRRHNIKTGAAAVNGLLIKPGEEFSLNKALGKIEKSTGYLPELVIKDNKTTPEYGGGLCQIGTTMFRGALSSGLPITLRRNHSYRVSYYEPAGTDATIYDPWPDLKFINDTGRHVLIQSRIEGDKLFFDFWGTKDGRTVEQTKPAIYNIVKPGPTKLIETVDLPVGQKKCTEHAHNGADAYFDYKVTYSSGEIYPVKNSCSEAQKEITPDCQSATVSQTAAWDKISNGVKEKRFSSHYVPWQEVCLVGVAKLSSDNMVASTTPPATTE